MCVSMCLFVCEWQVLTGLVDMHPLPAIVLEHRHIAKMLGEFEDCCQSAFVAPLLGSFDKYTRLFLLFSQEGSWCHSAKGPCERWRSRLGRLMA
jgi:hypothetical protein